MKDTSEILTRKAVCLDSITHADYRKANCKKLIAEKIYDAKPICNEPPQVSAYDLSLEGEHIATVSKKQFDDNFRWL